ncbi:hypothetical protein [Nonomuraea rhodomycinica]|uniref:Uncharacterized protein n=1 Tax=Nonomuraea rhodomycinica TaxID=1712872 RepID=A0A7Y6IVW2_9ACTN|nr:hypothetical protein [Nonomuraea rhodomycinica]NUW44783.1 hypothetical protein [Nonomuraea rhodomycinica]
MGTSKQMAFTLACAVAFSVLVPGAAGYLSGRLEAVESAERQLHAIETRLRSREAREDRQAWPVAFPAPCGVQTPDTRQPGARERAARPPGPHEAQAGPPAPQEQERGAQPFAPGEQREARPPAPQARPPVPRTGPQAPHDRDARPPAALGLGGTTGHDGTGVQARRPATTDPFGWLPQLIDRLRWDR